MPLRACTLVFLFWLAKHRSPLVCCRSKYKTQPAVPSCSPMRANLPYTCWCCIHIHDVYTGGPDLEDQRETPTIPRPMRQRNWQKVVPPLCIVATYSQRGSHSEDRVPWPCLCPVRMGVDLCHCTRELPQMLVSGFPLVCFRSTHARANSCCAPSYANPRPLCHTHTRTCARVHAGTYTYTPSCSQAGVDPNTISKALKKISLDDADGSIPNDGGEGVRVVSGTFGNRQGLRFDAACGPFTHMFEF